MIEEIDDRIVRMSNWINNYIGPDDPALMWKRVAKCSEEAGEALRALGKADGAHRDPEGFTLDDVCKELMDTAGAALMAWVHIHGNQPGQVMEAFREALENVNNRVGA